MTSNEHRYAYDLAGRVINVTDWANHAWTFTRDAAGRLTALSYPNGVSGSWTHDANHKVSGWSYNNGSPVAGRTITRDDAGVKIKEQVTAGLFPNPQNPRRSANVFDAADRLTSSTVAEGTNTFTETYLYDLNGALTNRHSAAGDQQFEYDCAGRMMFAAPGNTALSVTYDALGNRLTTYSANSMRIWVTDHADPRKRPLMEADSNGVPVRYYVWGGGLLLAVVEADGTMRYCHSDEQGSVVALTDSNGSVTDQYCYGPYGTDWGREGTNSIPFRWLGSHGVFNVGDSSLYLTRYRAYDSSLGRFLSSDPVGLDGGPNLYAYCMGSPLAYIDPLGLGAESSEDPSYWERYFEHLDEYLINVGPYASAMLGGIWPKSWSPATAGRPPLLGSRNPLTSVPRAIGVPGAGSTVVRTGAAGIGVATVGLGFYNIGVIITGFGYAAFPGSNGL